jgi:hypothetical protein
MSFMEELEGLSEDEFPDTIRLQRTLFAAYDSNWGLACESLTQALDLMEDSGFSWEKVDDWLRASAVLLHLSYGVELLEFLDRHGHTARLRPWVEALRAHVLGNREALLNVAPEIRTTAESFYDRIRSYLDKLPDRTRRRPLQRPTRTRAKRAKS